jgi:SAM-dependent methyltransferase
VNTELNIFGDYKVDANGIVVFDDTKTDTDDTVYDIENGFIKELKIMAFLEFVRMSHVLKISRPKDNVLDIGCAYGQYGYTLYTNMMSTNYVGMDIKYAYLERASKRKWGNSNPTFIHKNAVNGLPFEYKYFDVVLLIQVIEHLGIDNAKKLLSEIRNVMSDKGTLILTTENNKFTEGGGLEFHVHEFKYEEIVQLIKDSGFIIKNEFGLMYGDNIKTVESSKLKEFLVGRHFKILHGISHPQDSKYIVFDIGKAV